MRNGPLQRVDGNYEIAVMKIGVFGGIVLHIHVQNLHLKVKSTRSFHLFLFVVIDFVCSRANISFSLLIFNHNVRSLLLRNNGLFRVSSLLIMSK